MVMLAYISSYPAFYLVKIGSVVKGDLIFSFVAMLGALVTMLLVPLFVFRDKKVEDFGFQLPEINRNILLIIIPPLIICLYFIHSLSQRTEFIEYYSLKHDLDLYFIIEIFISFFYYISEEFFFRGFLFFYFLDKIKFHSFWLTNLLFSLLHFGKPGAEIMIAFVVGVWLSYISFKSKSFLPAAVIHFVLALYLNILINF